MQMQQHMYILRHEAVDAIYHILHLARESVRGLGPVDRQLLLYDACQLKTLFEEQRTVADWEY